MFRFYFNNDETESVAISFHFSTSRFVLALKRQEMVFAPTLEELIDKVSQIDGIEHGKCITVIQRAFESKKEEFEHFLRQTEEEIRTFHDWLGRQGETLLPVGLGYIKNPSDPTKGSKNTMSGTP